MNFSKYNLGIICLSFILTLGILLGGRWVYQEFGVMGPLQKNLAETPAVTESMIETDGGKLNIELKLGEIQSLNQSLQDIKKILPKDSKYNLTIKDRRNNYLEGLWTKNRFALEEAACLGNLTEMQGLLEANLEEADLERWLLEVDEENIYLQMHEGKAYLYEIVQRRSVSLNDNGKQE